MLYEVITVARRDGLDLARLGRPATDRSDMHDLFTFLASHLGPIIRVSRIV